MNTNKDKHPSLLILLSFILVVMSLPPIGLSFLGLFFLLPLFVAISGENFKSCFFLGAAWGTILAGYCFWGTISYIPWLYFLLIFIFAAIYGLCLVITGRLLINVSALRITAISCCWVCAELLMEQLNIPFSLSISLSDQPEFLQSAYLGGQYFVTWSLVFFQLALYALLTKGIATRQKSIIIQYGLCLLIPVFATLVTNIDRPTTNYQSVTVTVVQTNIKPYIGHNLAADFNLEYIFQEIGLLNSEIATQKPDLVIWPETSFTSYLGQNNMFRSAITGVNIVNSVYLDEHGNRYNAIFQQQGNETLNYVRSKSLLVPHVESNSFASRNLENIDNSETLPLICFESAFPLFSTTLMHDKINLISISTSDAFAGPSFQYLFHAQFAKIRAIEFNRFVIRAANGGASTILDNRGRILQQGKAFSRGLLTEPVKLITHPSIFSKTYKAWITFFVFGFSLALFVLVKERNTGKTVVNVALLPLCGSIIFTGLFFIFLQHKVSTRFYLDTNPSSSNKVWQTYRTDESAPKFISSISMNTEDSLAGAISYVLRSYGIPTYTKYILELNSLENYLDTHNLRIKAGNIKIAGPRTTPFIARHQSGEYLVVVSESNNNIQYYSPLLGQHITISNDQILSNLQDEFFLLEFRQLESL